MSLAWETFGEKNGAGSFREMRARLAGYRRVEDDGRTDYDVGCILLGQPFFLPEKDWIPAPADWKRNIVRGKGYDATGGEGRRLWERVRPCSRRVRSGLSRSSLVSRSPAASGTASPRW